VCCSLRICLPPDTRRQHALSSGHCKAIAQPSSSLKLTPKRTRTCARFTTTVMFSPVHSPPQSQCPIPSTLVPLFRSRRFQIRSVWGWSLPMRLLFLLPVATPTQRLHPTSCSAYLNVVVFCLEQRMCHAVWWPVSTFRLPFHCTVTSRVSLLACFCWVIHQITTRAALCNCR